jgi:putative intracellular protease/amidase
MTIAVAFLQPGWADWEAGPVLALLRREFGVQVEVATPDGEPQTSIGGLLAAADYRFDDPVLSDADVFLLIGSDAWVEFQNEAVFALLRQAVADGKIVGAICAGTVAAARARLFEGREHTSNGKDWLEKAVPGHRGETYVDQPRAVVSGKVVSAPGSAPISFAAAVARLVAPEGEAGIQAYEEMFGREFARD